MLRVLIVNSADVMRKTTDSLARGLSDQGHEVCVLTPDHPKTEGCFDNDDSIELIPYESQFVPKIRYSVPTYDFVEIMRSEATAADVVVITSAVYLPSVVGTLVSHWSKTPTVVTIDALVGINWSYGSNAIDMLGKGFVLTLSRLAFRSADVVVGLTNSLEDYLPALVDESKIRIIPNGIDTDHFAPSSNRESRLEEPIELLFVGRLSPVKGIEYLLSAFAALREGPVNVRLTVVGDGEKRDAYVDRAVQLGVDDAITWTGWDDDVKQYYEQADILVLPSISEGQPSVVMEAQACGVPVVATDVGDVSNLVEAGRVVPPEDPAEIRDAVLELTEEDPAELSTRGRKHVVERYSLGSMVESYLEVFSELSEGTSVDADRADQFLPN